MTPYTKRLLSGKRPVAVDVEVEDINASILVGVNGLALAFVGPTGCCFVLPVTEHSTNKIAPVVMMSFGDLGHSPQLCLLDPKPDELRVSLPMRSVLPRNSFLFINLRNRAVLGLPLDLRKSSIWSVCAMSCQATTGQQPGEERHCVQSRSLLRCCALVQQKMIWFVLRR